MEKTGFIYLWFDRKHKRYYLGSHLGTEDDGYICSSRWMRQSYKRRPQDFKRRILERGIAKEVLKEEEYKWLKQIKNEELGERYYNLTNILNGNGWVKGKPRSKETKQKVSEGLQKAWEEGRCSLNKSHFKKGQAPWNKGKTRVYSEETLEKIKQARQQQVFTKEVIEKRSAKLRGRKRPKEVMDKMVQTKKERRTAGLYKPVVPWNKGLTKNDPRVEKYASKQRGVKRKHESI